MTANRKDMDLLLRTTSFQAASTNRHVVEALADGKWHSKIELRDECGAQLQNINYVVNRLRDDFGFHVVRGNIPPEEGRRGADGVKWAIIYDDVPGPAIKDVYADNECIEFTRSGRKYAIRSSTAGLYITGPGVELLV